MGTSTAKYVSLCLLVIQNSLQMMMLRYSRTVPTRGPRYMSTSVVFMSEILKFVTSLVVIFYQSNYDFNYFLKDINAAAHPLDLFKIAVPSGIYAIKNNLLFVALSYLDAATFQATYQLKVLTTVVFTIVILKKSLSLQQWRSLFFLMIGVAMVQFPPEPAEKHDIVWSNQLFGLLIIVLACLTSSFAGVYFELLLKEKKFSLWIRNLQMGGFGIIFAGIQMWWNDGEMVLKYGILQGYSHQVLVLLLQAYGGLLVACVINFIIKGFASSLAIIVSYILSYLVLDEIQPTLLFTCGAGLVVTSTFMYGQKPQKIKSV